MTESMPIPRLPTLDRGPGARVVYVSLIGWALAQSVLAYPGAKDFFWTAFGDYGSSLTAESLLRRGYVPNVDFGQPYGLLTLLIGRAWFGLFGLSTGAYVGLMALPNVAIGWGLARAAWAVRPGWGGLAALLLAMPHLAGGISFGIAHGMEAALLVHALADQAQGRRSKALALCAVALFVKGSMAYLHGFALVVLIVADLWRSGRPIRDWWRPFLPAAGVVVALTVLCAAYFGIESLGRNLLFPFTGGPTFYRAMGYGAATGLRGFLGTSGVTPWQYLAMPPSAWLAATLLLLAAGSLAVFRSPDPHDAPRGRELLLTCLALHLAATGLLYSYPWSWRNYFFYAMLGLAAIPRSLRAARASLWIVVGLLALTAGVHLKRQAGNWRTRETPPHCYGLFVTKSVADEWARVLERVGDRPALVLAFAGCVELLDPRFAPPETHWLLPGEATASEVARERTRIDHAQVVVIPSDDKGGFLRFFPELTEALRDFEPAWRSDRFTVLERARSTGAEHPDR